MYLPSMCFFLLALNFAACVDKPSQVDRENIPEPSVKNPYVEGIQFYSCNDRSHTETIEFNEYDIHGLPNFDKSQRTVFITHGWITNYEADSCMTICEAYLASEYKVNVILVDWSSFANLGYLTLIEHHVKNIANEITARINLFEAYGYIALDKTSLIGFSLGAHVMGLVGRYMNGAIDRIYGLDPAGPMFYDRESLRVTNESARYVQIIHTTIASAGYVYPLGHADFYLNGGKTQNGCMIKDIWTRGGCSHARAYYSFADSIKSPRRFRCRRCSCDSYDCVHNCTGEFFVFMGENYDYPEVRGVFDCTDNS